MSLSEPTKSGFRSIGEAKLSFILFYLIVEICMPFSNEANGGTEERHGMLQQEIESEAGMHPNKDDFKLGSSLTKHVKDEELSARPSTESGCWFHRLVQIRRQS